MRNGLLRLISSALLVGAAIFGLWKTGILFEDVGGPQVRQVDGEILPLLEAADTAIETPNPDRLTVGLKEGQLAPDFEFSAYDGKRKRLSDYRGEVVFLNFWATWCGPCRVELPDMQTLLGEHPDGLVVIAVNNGEDAAPARRYLGRIGVHLPAFAHDPSTAVVRLYGLYGMPTSYFIDAEGIITRVHTGQLSLNVMRSAVQEALPGATTSQR